MPRVETSGLALKSDGTVVGWGLNGQATPPSGLTGVTAIAAGSNHGLALKSDGTVVAGEPTTPADYTRRFDRGDGDRRWRQSQPCP